MIRTILSMMLSQDNRQEDDESRSRDLKANGMNSKSLSNSTKKSKFK